VPGGPARGVFLTIAGEAGAPVLATSDTYRNLQDSLHCYGDPLMPLTLVTYRDSRFRVRLNVKVAADAESEIVLPAIEARLREAFGFEARGFGQGVSVDEVEAIAQNVGGVEAVHVPQLHRSDAPSPIFVPRLYAASPLASLTTVPLAAELLTLDDAPLQLDLLP
jgi:hypothetical protein